MTNNTAIKDMGILYTDPTTEWSAPAKEKAIKDRDILLSCAALVALVSFGLFTLMAMRCLTHPWPEPEEAGWHDACVVFGLALGLVLGALAGRGRG